MPSDDLVSSLQELADLLQTNRTLGGALARIAEVATLSVPGCDAASIAISIESRPSTAAISARIALELDLVQYDADDGPCLQSFRTMETVRMDLIEPDDRFPHFARAARDAGIVGVYSLPATWRSEVVGSLNLYSRSRAFDESAETIARVLAAQIAIAISRSPEYAAARDVADQAQQLADDRSAVNVATGLLMGNEGCTAEQAEGLLREAAAHEERSIVQIAQRIIEQHQSSS
jgi:GAF domain-containing protein